MRRPLFTIFSALSLLACLVLIAHSIYVRWRMHSILASIQHRYAGQGFIHDSYFTYSWGPAFAAICATAVLPLLWCGAFLSSRMRRRRSPEDGACGNCGYNLTGNVSGVCPECGTAIVISNV